MNLLKILLVTADTTLLLGSSLAIAIAIAAEPSRAEPSRAEPSRARKH